MSEGEPARIVARDPGFDANVSATRLGRVIRGGAMPIPAHNFPLKVRMFSFWGPSGGPRCMTDVRESLNKWPMRLAERRFPPPESSPCGGGGQNPSTSSGRTDWNTELFRGSLDSSTSLTMTGVYQNDGRLLSAPATPLLYIHLDQCSRSLRRTPLM